MSISRFYTPENLELEIVTALPSNASTHASRVLRLTVGDHVTLFNGDGYDYLCELMTVTKSTVTAKVGTKILVSSESPLNITLLQAISSGDRMDNTIQKAIELGVNKIQPINSQRSLIKLAGERAEKRKEHWQNVVISACEQSGRAIVPQVHSAITLANWLSHNPLQANSTRITLSPTATQNLQDLLSPNGEIYLLIGAEGGLTQDEIQLASTQGFKPVQLGKRILRTETAALAAVSAMQVIWGDF
ncbi:MAG: 16S rRNA (uracil(1498)-N(3))-methyltransferase [Methylophilaceae bacterium]|nr:16S rRNA (uracil(1498)-N(3))-methyltransferase [Methylophilaceae bacterium]